MNILLTGGLGYIGSHTAIVLTEAGHEVVIYDNLCNSHPDVLDSLERILSKRLTFVHGDIRDYTNLLAVMSMYSIEAVIHFAGLKAVGESVEKPLDYYDNNIGGTISLLKAMSDSNIHQLVFSSSATVYGDPEYLPIDEKHPTSATNPYGKSKLHIEQMLQDLPRASSCWSISILRYFNPVGAHSSGLIGENPSGIPSNLMPYIADVAAKERAYLNVWGNDYATADGTGVRDYIHVMDLAIGHIRALEHLKHNPGVNTFNLGTGKGYSVLEVIQTFEKINQVTIPYQIKSRRPGDIAACYASPDLAHETLNWKAKFDLVQMCKDQWQYKQKNKPNPLNSHTLLPPEGKLV